MPSRGLEKSDRLANGQVGQNAVSDEYKTWYDCKPFNFLPNMVYIEGLYYRDMVLRLLFPH